MAIHKQCVCCKATRGLSAKGQKRREAEERYRGTNFVAIQRLQQCDQCGEWVCKRCAGRHRRENTSLDTHAYIVCSTECGDAMAIRRRMGMIGYGTCAKCTKVFHDHQLLHDMDDEVRRLCVPCTTEERKR